MIPHFLKNPDYWAGWVMGMASVWIFSVIRDLLYEVRDWWHQPKRR